MPGLSNRQEFFLGLIVREYVQAAQPVGSKTLVARYALDFSPATVRNEMVALTEAGMLRQPHTSAGRVPTDDGYRYFVQRLTADADLPSAEKRTISHQFYQAQGDVDQWLRLAASVLAQHSSVASVVTAPSADRSLLRHLELILVQARQVQLILVLQGGEVLQQMLSPQEPASQDTLTRIAAQVTARCQGADAAAVQRVDQGLDPLAPEILRMVAEMMRRADRSPSPDVIYDGLSNVLNQPEFADRELAQRAMHLIEEHTLLSGFLARVLAPDVDGVQVVIGGEGQWEDLRDCSMVVARYGAPGLATGALGVLGPVRMAYDRTISAVRYVATVMSELVTEAFSE
ncbi:MAG TPA: heat-inducible transcriptional repressor HrcA [Anaerolineales bacterium]|nr:heat-inducible transcriptional repressor HrcA [Anaerolineales bacterium]